MMNKALILLLPFLLIATAYATYPSTNTIFSESGLANNVGWQIAVFSIRNTTNVINPFSQNTATSNIITTNAIPNGQYYFIASYPISSPSIYINGTVNVGGDNNFNFNYVPSTNSIYVGNYLYFYCLTLNTSKSFTYQGGSLCVSYTGSVPASAQGLQSQIIGAPFSANLTIYINPEGYFEYIINNGKAYDTIPQGLWINTPPGMLTTSFNLSLLGHTVASSKNSTGNFSVILNGTYKGAILYSDLIDISPIEYQMLDGNLTPNNFVGFIQTNEGSFYNTTLVYSLCPNVVQLSKDYIGIAGTWIVHYLTGLVGYVLTSGSTENIAAINNAEVSVSASFSIPKILNGIQDYNSSAYQYPLYVSYAYPDTLCQISQLNLGVCIKSGQQGMIGFNTYIDNTYEPEIVMNEFLSSSAVTIILLTFAILFVKKANGE